MDSNFEELIANAFFQKQIRDRIFYELCSKNRRKYVIKKLSHTCLNYIDSKCIVKTNKMLISPNEILGFLKNNSQNNECYCISDNNDCDGVFIDVSEAIDILYGNGSPALIVMKSTGKSYLETEYDFSVHWNYFLTPKIKMCYNI